MDMDSSVRRAAAQGLGKFADSECVENLRKLNIDADRYAREAAIDAIAKIQARVMGTDAQAAGISSTKALVS
jgi:HEAT repeat protein